jgi:hypothetical protein
MLTPGGGVIGTTVGVGGIGVSVGGTGVSVGGTGVSVGGTGVSVGVEVGSGFFVGGGEVDVQVGKT